MSPPYPFDVLPIHPPPYTLETLSSYLTRLATLNGIGSFEGLGVTLLGTYYSHSNRLVDAPPQHPDAVGCAAHCSVERVLESTFFYLADKFGRTHIRKFVAPSVALTLRYCPGCLSEHSYYRLPWRFSSLVGCPIHRCTLLDRCPHCAGPVPLFTEILLIGTCPICRHDLRVAQPVPLSADRLAFVQRCHDDLTYLLTAQAWQSNGENIRRSIGPYLKFMRVEQHQLARDLCSRFEVPKTAGTALEHATHAPAGNHFGIYLGYADALGTDWKAIFGTLERDFQQSPCDAKHMRTQSLLTKTSAAIRTLEAAGQTPTIVSVGRLVGMNGSALCRYPDVDRLLRPVVQAQHSLDHKQQHAEELLTSTKAAVDWLLDHEQPITWTAIAERVGLTARTLSQDYPAIKQFLTNINGRAGVQARREQRQSAFLQAVQSLVQELIDNGEAISLRRVARLMKVAPATICSHYPDAQQFLNEASARQKAHLLALRDADLLQRLEAAILVMEVQHLPVTRKTVAKALGFAPTSLTYYPRVAARLKQIAGHSNSARYKRLLKQNDIPQPR